MEHRHHRRCRGRPELRAGARARARRTVRAGRRVPRCGAEALGQLGGRRDRRRQGGRSVGRRREDPPAASPGDVLQCRGCSQRPPLAPGLPPARAGGFERGRQGVRGAVRGGGVHRAADPRRRPGLLRGPQVPYGSGRSGPGAHQGAARHRPGTRLDGDRGAGQRTAPGEPHRVHARCGPPGATAPTTLRIAGVGCSAPRRSASRGRHRGREEPLHPRRRTRPPRPADRTAVDRAEARWRARASHLRRYAGAGRRRDRVVVHAGRRRRLQHHARGPAVRPRRLRGPRRPDPPHPRPAPHGVRPAHHPPGALRPPRPANQYARPTTQSTQPALV